MRVVDPFFFAGGVCALIPRRADVSFFSFQRSLYRYVHCFLREQICLFYSQQILYYCLCYFFEEQIFLF